MKSIKVILAGIVLILSGLFFLGIHIINSGVSDGLSLFLFILGIIVSIIGLFFVRDNEDYENDDDYENDEDEEDEK